MARCAGCLRYVGVMKKMMMLGLLALSGVGIAADPPEFAKIIDSLNESYMWQHLKDGSHYSMSGKLYISYFTKEQGIAIMGNGRYNNPAMSPWAYSLSMRVIKRWCGLNLGEDEMVDGLYDVNHVNASQDFPYKLYTYRVGTCNAAYGMDEDGVASIWIKRVSPEKVWPPKLVKTTPLSTP